MRRWLATGFIAIYLTALLYGLAAQTLGFQVRSHVGMYFLVWDMFCGWDSFDCRPHLVAEGVSGTHYELTAPWMQPTFAFENRRLKNDTLAAHAGRLAAHALDRTEHEPIARVILVEEARSKKYNVPGWLWSRRFAEPQSPVSHFYLRAVFEPTGENVVRHYAWKDHIVWRALSRDPSVLRAARRSTPYYSSGEISRGGSIEQAGHLQLGF